jgi:hypothetical protein
VFSWSPQCDDESAKNGNHFFVINHKEIGQNYNKKINYQTDSRLLVNTTVFQKSFVDSSGFRDTSGTVKPPIWEHGRNYSSLNWHSVSSQISVPRFFSSRYRAVTEPRHLPNLPISRDSDVLLCACLYGVPDTRNSAVQSYIDNVFKVLESRKIKFEVFVHSYATEYDNEINALQPRMIITERRYQQRRNEDGANGTGFANDSTALLLDIHSLEQVTQMWMRDQSAECSHLLYAPLDTVVLKPLNIDALYQVVHKSVVSTLKDEKNGVYDRIALGDPVGMQHWGTLRTFIEEKYTKDDLLDGQLFSHLLTTLGISYEQDTVILSNV